jgi:hypothetical protein
VVGFVENKNISDLHDAGLSACTSSPIPHEHHQRHVRNSDDLDFILTHADGFRK